MEAHEMFQKGVADLHYQTNKLTQAQKDLDLANKAMSGAQGYRYSIEGDPSSQVYDPSMLQMAPPVEKTQKPSGMSRDEWQWREDYKAGIKAKAKVEKDKEDAKKYVAYEEVMSDVADIASGNIPWTVNDDGEMVSTFWQGKRFGSPTTGGIIQDIIKEGDKFFIRYGSSNNPMDDPKMVEVSPDIFHDIYTGYILGQSSEYDAKVAGEYSSKFREEERTLGELQREDGGFLQKAEEAKEKKAQEDIEAQVVALTDVAGKKSNNKGEKSLNEALGGKEFTTEDGKTVTVTKVEKNTVLAGKYTIYYTDNESGEEGSIAVGEDGTKNLDIIGKILKSNGSSAAAADNL
jgi:hypothetical protein